VDYQQSRTLREGVGILAFLFYLAIGTAYAFSRELVRQHQMDFASWPSWRFFLTTMLVLLTMWSVYAVVRIMAKLDAPSMGSLFAPLFLGIIGKVIVQTVYITALD
jgi:hypothetical protein